MKILITGGTGFIGSPLVSTFAQKGHNIHVFTRNKTGYQNTSQIQYHQINLDNQDKILSFFNEIKPQILIHLAWEGLPDYSYKFCQKNLIYSTTIFSIAANSGCKMIISTGSCWEYDSKIGKISENSKLNSKSVFSATKNSLRLIGKAIAYENHCQFYWLRLFYVYGQGQRETSLIPSILKSIQDGNIPDIRTPNDKNDFIFVDDVVRAIDSIISVKPKKTTYNVGSGYLTSIKEIVTSLYSLVGKKIDQKTYGLLTKDENKPLNEFFADISKISKNTCWKPQIPINIGLKYCI